MYTMSPFGAQKGLGRLRKYIKFLGIIFGQIFGHFLEKQERRYLKLSNKLYTGFRMHW